MSILENVADRLAQTALDAEESYEDEKIVDVMAEAIKNSSPTLTEAFLRFRYRDGTFNGWRYPLTISLPVGTWLSFSVTLPGAGQQRRGGDTGGDTAPEVTE